MARKTKQARDSRSGWFSVDRSLLNAEIWLGEPFTRGQAWIDLIGLARFEAGPVRLKGTLLEVARGQVARSEGNLADRWAWSRGKVRRFLNELETEQRIVQQKTNVTTLITLVNYDQYQHGSTANGTGAGTGNGTAGSTADGTAGGTRNKKDNNGNNGINKVHTFSSDNEMLQSAVDDWLKYKHERNEDYKPTGLANLFLQILKKCELHGHDAVIEAIREAMGSNYQGFMHAFKDGSRNGSANRRGGKGATGETTKPTGSLFA